MVRTYISEVVEGVTSLFIVGSSTCSTAVRSKLTHKELDLTMVHFCTLRTEPWMGHVRQCLIESVVFLGQTKGRLSTQKST